MRRINDEDLFTAVRVIPRLAKQVGVRQGNNAMKLCHYLEVENMDEIVHVPYYSTLRKIVNWVVRKNELPHKDISGVLPLLKRKL